MACHFNRPNIQNSYVEQTNQIQVLQYNGMVENALVAVTQRLASETFDQSEDWKWATLWGTHDQPHRDQSHDG